jgi:hypothetical protein
MLKNFGDTVMKMDNYLKSGIAIVISLVFWAGCQPSQTKTVPSTPADVTTESEASIEAEKVPSDQLKPVQPVKVSPDSPQLKMENSAVDFGQAGPSSIHKAEYKFSNIGKESLIISNIQSTCGCSQPTLYKDGQKYTIPLSQSVSFNQGESGSVEVTFTAPAVKGVVTKHLYIMSNDPRSPRSELEIKADVVVKVEVAPENVQLRFDKENAGMPELTVRSLDDKEFSIRSITIPNNVMKIAFDPAQKAASFVLKPEVDTKLLDTYSTGAIQIMTDHPQSGTLLVRYTALPFVEVNRPRIILQNVEPGVPVVKDVLLRSNYDKAIEIASSESRNGYMQIESDEQDGLHRKLMVKITPPAQTSSAKRYITDELTITLKTGEQVIIRCSGWYKI